MTETFEAALAQRVDAMLDACTRCGKCVEVCPVTGPGGVNAEPRDVIAGIIDIVRTGEGPQASRKWANACVLTGECIKACDYGVNPRFLLGMARVAMARRKDAAPERRRQGVEGFRKVARDVTHISRMQLDDALLARLGQKADSSTTPATAPDFVFYTGCNVLKTPHIALLALDIMDTLGITYQVLGGPSHCCGIVQMRTGDVATSGRFAESTMDKLARAKSGQVISWCPSCHVQFTETTLPTVEKARGARPFEMTPFMLFLRAHLDRLRPHLKQRVGMRVALHRHPGIKGVVEAAEDILRAIPGVELIDLGQPAVGLMSNYFRALPAYRRELQKKELDAAEAAQADALVAVYHADHRELCAHERDYPFRIMNLLELVGESMGIRHADHFKRLKMMQDVDAIAADCGDLIARHGLDPVASRQAIEAMLEEAAAAAARQSHLMLQADTGAAAIILTLFCHD
jgi:heterodisulfide reductase subunit D